MLTTRAISLCVLMVSPWVPVARGENLLSIYNKAVANDGRFASALGSYDANIEKYPQGRALLLPTLTGSTETTRYESKIEYRGDTAFEGGSRHYRERKSAVQLTQPLYRLQNYHGFRQSQAQLAAAEAQLVAAKQDLMLRVAQAYFDVLTAQQALGAARGHAAATKGQFSQAQKKLAVGSASRLELSEATARADLARTQEIAAQHELENKRQALRRIVNERLDTVDELRADFPLLPPEPTTVEPWIEQAERENPQLQAQQHNLRAAQREVKRARGAHYPTLDLIGQYTNSYSTGSVYTSASSDTQISSAGLRLELPFYQGGIVTSRVREALGNAERARGEAEDARREITAQTTQNFNGAVSSIEQVQALEQALTSSKEAARANRVGLEVGTRNFVEVLDADKQVYEVMRDLAKARHEYVMSLLRLKAFAGQLKESDLAALNAYLVAPAQ